MGFSRSYRLMPLHHRPTLKASTGGGTRTMLVTRFFHRRPCDQIAAVAQRSCPDVGPVDASVYDVARGATRTAGTAGSKPLNTACHAHRPLDAGTPRSRASR